MLIDTMFADNNALLPSLRLLTCIERKRGKGDGHVSKSTLQGAAQRHQDKTGHNTQKQKTDKHLNPGIISVGALTANVLSPVVFSRASKTDKNI